MLSLGRAFPFLCSRAPGRKLFHVSDALVFVTAAKGMPPDWLALDATGPCVLCLVKL